MKENQIDISNEFARPIDWSPAWNFGAPLPQLFSNGHQTFLTYFIDTPDPSWDGSYTTLIDNKSDSVFPIAVVTFIRPNSHRFGIANDEAADGHPLYNKGLEVYRAHIIENSRWIEELKQIHMVHPRYSDKHWIDYKHFLLFFHDEIFEIIAKDYKIEVINSTFKEVALEVAKRLNS
ncbi:MAG TPA: hypothetical protein VFN95_06675 [Flavitalea sp.]|nr:hypothetical protein [Flavitalea sp.]